MISGDRACNAGDSPGSNGWPGPTKKSSPSFLDFEIALVKRQLSFRFFKSTVHDPHPYIVRRLRSFSSARLSGKKSRGGKGICRSIFLAVYHRHFDDLSSSMPIITLSLAKGINVGQPNLTYFYPDITQRLKWGV